MVCGGRRVNDESEMLSHHNLGSGPRALSRGTTE